MIFIRTFIISSIIVTLSFFCTQSVATTKDSSETTALKPNSSVSFKENKGQVHDQHYKKRTDILYSGSVGGMVYHLKQNGVHYQLSKVDKWKEEEIPGSPEKEKIKVPSKTTVHRLDISWLGSNPNAEIIANNPLDGYENYYLPSCPDGAVNVKSYQEVTYKKIYEGIDLIFHNKNNELHYDFRVNPGADYSQIKIKIEGAEIISKNRNGDIVIQTPLGKIIEGKPIVFQKGKQLEANWIINKNELSFNIKNVDPNYELIIDPPVRNWGTYYGGNGFSSGQDETLSCSTDNDNNVYMAILTHSINFIATTGAHQTINLNSGYSAALIKFSSTGNQIWGTYYGGEEGSIGYSCAPDKYGNIYLAGSTRSLTSIATSGAHQTILGGQPGHYGVNDAFVVKFNENGIRLWGTYYGGITGDWFYSCQTSNDGDIYLVGETMSISGISTSGAHQANISSSTPDAILVKFNSNGTRIWGTYYGGSLSDKANSCAIDSNGNIYMAGRTYSTNNISTSGVHQTTLEGSGDAFLVKFDSNGTRIWGTYYGGENYEDGKSCAIDNNGNIYMTGWTSSELLISTVGAHQIDKVGFISAFLVSFNTSGIRQWGTYYGGVWGQGRSCSIDHFGNIFIVGTTTSDSLISTTNVHQEFYNGNKDAFLAKFDINGMLQWGSYYGGSERDDGVSCSLDQNGSFYICGTSRSSDFNSIATSGSHQDTLRGGADAFLVKFCVSDSLPSIIGPSNICVNNNNSLFYIDGEYNLNWTVPLGATIVSGQGTDSIIVNFGLNGGNIIASYQNSCGISFLQSIAITINTIIPVPTIFPLIDTICVGGSTNLMVSGGTSYLWNTGDTTSSITVSPNVDSSYSVIVSDNGCDSLSQPINIVVNPIFFFSDTSAICQGDSALVFGLYQSTSGTYYDSLQTIFGCDSVLSTFIIVNPIYSYNDTTSICQGDSIFLGAAYQINNGLYYDTLQSVLSCDSLVITNLIINPIENYTASSSICQGDSVLLGGIYQFNAGTYYDTLATAAGCDSLVNTILTIKVLPPVPITNDTLVCLDDGIPTLSASSFGLGIINWFSDPGLLNLIYSGNNYSPSIDSHGQFTYYLQSFNNGCSSPVSTVNLQVNNPIAIINPSELSGLSPLETVFNNGSLNSNWYAWNFGTGDTSNLFSPSYIFENEGSYIVELKVSDSFGCLDSTQVTIEVDTKYFVSIPNTITPNDDGFNDFWIIENLEKFPDHSIQIFNRNGSSVFETNNYQNDWSGEYKGNELPATTYYYIIDLGDGEEVLKGDLSIIRAK
jgi:gliding motility-associated-like protein